MNRWKRDLHGLVVPLLICAVFTATASRAATPPVGRTIKLVREARPLSYGTAATSEGAVVAWVARGSDGVTELKAAWMPWNASAAGEVMTLATGIGYLPPELVARADGSVWIIYAAEKRHYNPSYCHYCSIQARILSAAGPVGDAPVTLAVQDGYLYQFHAGARPDGGLLLRWWHQDVAPVNINHLSMRAFDSQGIPLAESERLGGWYGRFAVADEGGGLWVEASEFSVQSLPYEQVFGESFNNEGALLRGLELSPPIDFTRSIEEYDVSRAAAGGYWLTWRVSREKLRARRVTAEGRPGRVLVAGSDPTATPLAPTPDDGFMVCWVSGSRLLAQLHGADARPRGRPILLARGDIGSLPSQYPLQLAVNTAGRGVVAWWSPRARSSQSLYLTLFTVSSEPTRDR